MRSKTIIIGVVFLSLVFAGHASAHSPLCSCLDNGDGTVSCEGGFSDGSSAAGVTMMVKDAAGKVLVKGKTDRVGTFVFKKPAGGAYKVVFDAGPGHVLEINSKDISK
jgi:hypothetical protein